MKMIDRNKVMKGIFCVMILAIIVTLMITAKGQSAEVFAKNDEKEKIYVSCDGDPTNDGKSSDSPLDFHSCFDDSGTLNPDFSGKILVLCGDFTNIDVNYITIDQEVELIGDEAVFDDTTFMICSDNVTLKNLDITQDSDIYAIYAEDCQNVTIEGNTIHMAALEGFDSYAIYAMDCNDLVIRDNTIYYVGNTDGTVVNNAVHIEAIEDDGNVLVEDNTFDITLPSVDLQYDPDTWVPKTFSEGLVFEGCAELTVSNNDIDVRSNNKIGSYDSLYGVSVRNTDKEDKEPREMEVLMEDNSITVSGEMYTYAVNFDAHSLFNFDDLMIRFSLKNNTIKASGDYFAECMALQDMVMGDVEGNELYADASEINYGINVYPYYGPNDEMSIVNNSITGKGRYSAGMEILPCEDVQIIGNEIHSLGSNALDDDGKEVPTGDALIPKRTSPAIILKTRGDIALVSGNEIESGGAGMILGSGYGTEVTVVDNDITVSDAKYGMALFDNDGELVIEDNRLSVTTLEDDEGYGIYSDNSDSFVICDNTIEYIGRSDGVKGHYNNAMYVSGREGASNIKIAENILDMSLMTEKMSDQQPLNDSQEPERPLLGGLVFDGCDNLEILDNTIGMKVVDGCMLFDDLYGIDLMLLKAEPKDDLNQAVVTGNSITSPGTGIHCVVPSKITDNWVLADNEYTVDVFAEDKDEKNASIVTGNKLRAKERWGDSSVHATDVDTVRNNKDISHRHVFSYSVSENEITATCSGDDDCDIITSPTLVISAPTDLKYDGNTKAATINDDLDKTAFPDTYVVRYYRGGNEIEAQDVKNAGSYMAKVTVGTVTAEIPFTILKAKPVYEKPEGLYAFVGQTLADVTLPEYWSWSDASTSVGSAGEKLFPAVMTPADKVNYDEVTEELTVLVKTEDKDSSSSSSSGKDSSSSSGKSSSSSSGKDSSSSSSDKDSSSSSTKSDSSGSGKIVKKEVDPVSISVGEQTSKAGIRFEYTAEVAYSGEKLTPEIIGMTTDTSDLVNVAKQSVEKSAGTTADPKTVNSLFEVFYKIKGKGDAGEISIIAKIKFDKKKAKELGMGKDDIKAFTKAVKVLNKSLKQNPIKIKVAKVNLADCFEKIDASINAKGKLKVRSLTVKLSGKSISLKKKDYKIVSVDTKKNTVTLEGLKNFEGTITVSL